ncbi:ALK and LTK ligand 2b [Menidia menidia]
MRPPPQLPVLLLLFSAGLWGPGARADRQRTALGFPGHPGRHRGLEGHPKDPRLKEVFIIHLTGPLYFNPKCRKQFHRLYNYTRDCTVPAYYKRCARLLTQLAKSPRCAER